MVLAEGASILHLLSTGVVVSSIGYINAKRKKKRIFKL